MTTAMAVVTFLLCLAGLSALVWIALNAQRRLAFMELEIKRIKLAALEDKGSAEIEVRSLASRVEVLESRIADGVFRPLESVNFTQRSQVIRMIRRGNTVDQIVSVLNVPGSQVRLLMKLPGVQGAPSNGKGQAAAGQATC